MAHGAQARDLLKLVVGQGMRLTLIGLIVGLAASFGVTRLIERLLFGVSATDPLTFVVIPLLLAGVALLACWIPARDAHGPARSPEIRVITSTLRERSRGAIQGFKDLD